MNGKRSLNNIFINHSFVLQNNKNIQIPKNIAFDLVENLSVLVIVAHKNIKTVSKKDLIKKTNIGIKPDEESLF